MKFRRRWPAAERVTNVAHAIVQECGAACVAALVGGQRHGPESRASTDASLLGAHAVRDVLLCFALDMERELVVQLELHPR